MLKAAASALGLGDAAGAGAAVPTPPPQAPNAFCWRCDQPGWQKVFNNPCWLAAKQLVDQSKNS
jgi:hypothetical protein